ncbi:hypothetical protein D3C80_1609420 [compost metagenome]
MGLDCFLHNMNRLLDSRLHRLPEFNNLCIRFLQLNALNRHLPELNILYAGQTVVLEAVSAPHNPVPLFIRFLQTGLQPFNRKLAEAHTLICKIHLDVPGKPGRLQPLVIQPVQ